MNGYLRHFKNNKNSRILIYFYALVSFIILETSTLAMQTLQVIPNVPKPPSEVLSQQQQPQPQQQAQQQPIPIVPAPPPPGQQQMLVPPPSPPLGQQPQAQAPTPVPLVNNKNGNFSAEENINSTDPCRTSDTINNSYNCRITKRAMDASQLTNITTQTVGAGFVASKGQQTMMNAMNNNSQADLLRSTAQLQEQTSEMQMISGGLNSAVAAYVLSRSYKHKNNGEEIESGSNSNNVIQDNTNTLKNANSFEEGQSGRVKGVGNEVASNIINNFKINENSNITPTIVTNPNDQRQLDQRDKDEKDHLKFAKTEVKNIARKAISEQNAMSQEAMAQGMISLITGAQQTAQGYFNYTAAKQLEASANKLSNPTSNSPPSLAVSAPTSLENGTSNTQIGTTPITGDGVVPNPSASTGAIAANPASSPLPDLGVGFGPNTLPSVTANGPLAGRYNVGSGGGSGGGGGGPSESGSTGVANAPPAEEQAKLAPNTTGNPNYEAGGGVGAIGRGGGGKGGDNGPDLGSLLAKFLPQQGEGQNNRQNGIEVYGNPPEKQPNSILGPDSPSLFERISKEMARQAIHGTLSKG